MSLLRERKVSIINQSYMNQQQIQNEQVKRKKKLLMRRLTVFFIFAGFILFMQLNTIYSQKEIVVQKEEQLKLLTTELKQIENQQNMLKDEITKLQDEEYIGKYARQEYFLSNNGEIIFSIPNEENPEDSD